MNKVVMTEARALKAHLAVNVKDVVRSAEFYGKLFSVDPTKVRSGYAKFDLVNPPLNFTLNQAPFQNAGALSHLGIQVASTEDVQSIRAKWLAAGLDVRDENGTDCCYALQNKSWVTDPDGNEWEVFVVLKDHLPEKAGAHSQCCVPESIKEPEAKGGCCVPGSACCTPECVF